jgi:hypothetical protein
MGTYIMARKTEFRIKGWSALSKDLLYKKAFQNDMSLNQMIKRILRDYLHREYPNKEIE